MSINPADTTEVAPTDGEEEEESSAGPTEGEYEDEDQASDEYSDEDQGYDEDEETSVNEPHPDHLDEEMDDGEGEDEMDYDAYANAFGDNEDEEEVEPEKPEPPPPKPRDPDGFDDDDDDNDVLMNMILQQTADAGAEDAGLEVLPEEVPEEPHDDEDNLAKIEGVVGITLSDETKKFFNIEELNAESPTLYTWLNWKQVKLHIFTYTETSEFHPHYDIIKYYPDLQMLLGVDVNKQTGNDYFMCLSVEARNRILHPSMKKTVFVDQKKKEEERWNLLSSIAPRKWRGFGSELEVDQEKAQDGRPPLTVTVHAYRTLFGEQYSFTNSDQENPDTFADFESQDAALFPSVMASETTRSVQVMAATNSSSTQTGLVFKRNKMVQHSVQNISNENAENIMKSKAMASFFRQTLPKLEKVLQQNEMVDLLYDDYGSLKPKVGHEVEFSGKRAVDPDLEPNIKDLKRFVVELLTEEPTPEAK